MISDIRSPVSLMPEAEPIAGANGKIDDSYQRWFQKILQNINDLALRQTPSLTYNPDFNWTRTKGTTPTTQADGDDASFIEQWNVFGAAGNTYTITPTSYANDAQNPTGSKYYPNFNITQLTAPLYIYNVNSSSDFNMAQKLQSNPLVLSMQVTNNNAESVKMRFKVAVTGIATPFTGKAVYAQAGTNKYWTLINLPSLAGTPAAANAAAQIQLHIEELGGDNADFNINYVKAEISNLGMNLDVNHILQKVLIDNL